MKYLDPNGLAKLKQADDARLDRLYRKKSTRSWTLTDKAGAVTCWPVGGTPLKPSVDFLFTEVLPASGDKGPDNPSTISGVSLVRVFRASANLLPETYSLVTSTDAPLTVVQNSDGSITINGASLSNKNAYSYIFGQSNDYSNKNIDYPIPAGTSYSWGYTVVSGTASITDSEISTESTPIALQVMRGTGVGTASIMANSTPDTESTRQNDTPVWIKMRVALWKNYTFNNYRIKPHLRFTNLSAASETSGAPCGEIFTLPLGNTYYGGTLDVASGVMTVTYASVALDENTYLSTQIFEELADVYVVGFYPNPVRLRPMSSASQAGCSILPIQIGTGAKNLQCIYLADNALSVRIQIAKTELGLGDGATGSDVRTAVHSWLGSHPGVLVYPILEPTTTVQLDPVSISALAQSDKYTPRLNTVYTDAQAVQAGYVKSPIREEYELTQAIVAQGGSI